MSTTTTTTTTTTTRDRGDRYGPMEWAQLIGPEFFCCLETRKWDDCLDRLNVVTTREWTWKWTWSERRHRSGQHRLRFDDDVDVADGKYPRRSVVTAATFVPVAVHLPYYAQHLALKVSGRSRKETAKNRTVFES